MVKPTKTDDGSSWSAAARARRLAEERPRIAEEIRRLRAEWPAELPEHSSKWTGKMGARALAEHIRGLAESEKTRLKEEARPPSLTDWVRERLPQGHYVVEALARRLMSELPQAMKDAHPKTDAESIATRIHEIRRKEREAEKQAREKQARERRSKLDIVKPDDDA
jgi:hypothetical protein